MQYIYDENDFSKPFFLTYFSTGLFSLNLLGFAISPRWRATPWTAPPDSAPRGPGRSGGARMVASASTAGGVGGGGVGGVIKSGGESGDEELDDGRALLVRGEGREGKVIFLGSGAASQPMCRVVPFLLTVVSCVTISASTRAGSDKRGRGRWRVGW